jgi:hypothetical protein
MTSLTSHWISANISIDFSGINDAFSTYQHRMVGLLGMKKWKLPGQTKKDKPSEDSQYPGSKLVNMQCLTNQPCYPKQFCIHHTGL